VKELAAVFEALAAGIPPPPEAARWVGSVGLAYLAGPPSGKGNRLDDVLGITAPPRSRRSPQAIYRESLRTGSTDGLIPRPRQDRCTPSGASDDNRSPITDDDP
jgi:hypothetical protein